MSRAHAVALLFALAGVLPGCALPLADREEPYDNSCQTDDACGANGVCEQGQCVSTRADLAGLLLRVDVPSGAGLGLPTTTVVDLAQDGVALVGAAPQGYVVSHDLTLGATQKVTLRLSANAAEVPEACHAQVVAGTLPASFQLVPERDVSGLSAPIYQGSTDVAEGADGAYEKTIDVAPGRYTVYVSPLAPAAEPVAAELLPCLPPTLVRGYEAGQPLTVTMRTPVELSGSIEGLDLSGWTADLVDEDSGRLLSSQISYTSDLRGLFYWPENRARLLIRLRPPAEASGEGGQAASAMPTIVWKLDAVDLDGDGRVDLDVSALDATPIQVSGTVLDAAGDRGLPAQLSLQSVKLLNGEFGTNAAYKRTIRTDDAGGFEVSLLAGTYRVLALPDQTQTKAITEAQWTLTQSDLGGGRTVVINDKSNLAGQASLAAGGPAYGIAAVLDPAPRSAVSYIKDQLLTLDLVPSSASGLTDANGAFTIAVDPGVFDLSLRPPAATGLPWLVRPRVTVQGQSEPYTNHVGPLSISNPVVLRGTLLTGGGRGVGGAQLQAWLPTGGGNGDKPTVILIGEATSDASGQYELRLPASVSK